MSSSLTALGSNLEGGAYWYTISDIEEVRSSNSPGQIASLRHITSGFMAPGFIPIPHCSMSREGNKINMRDPRLYSLGCVLG